MKFNFEDYKDKKVVMHCKTEQEAKEFCQLMHENGKKWYDGKTYLEKNKWFESKSNTCYWFNSGILSPLQFFEKYNFKILEWSNFNMSEFTKADLKNGDVVVTENGDVEIVMLDTGTLITRYGFNKISEINDDLTNRINRGYGIVKVYRPLKPYQCNFDNSCYTQGKLVYDREALEKPVEMTIEEIEKKLGVKNLKVVE